MLAWLTRTIGGSAPDALEQALRRYPPYAAPHPGPGTALSLEQAQRNLAYLLAQRAQRLQLLAGLLRVDGGPDIDAALAGADPAPLLAGLHAWANRQLPRLHRRHRALADREHWLNSARGGDEIVYSLVMDLALLLGELMRLGRPAFEWALDLDPVNGRDGMDSWRRPVLLARRAEGAQDETVEIDVEKLVARRFWNPEQPEFQWADGWGRVVREVRAGQHDRAL